MRKLFLLILVVSTTLLAIAQKPMSNPKNNYKIDVTLKPYKNQWIYLAHYFTNQTKYLVDSVLLDNNSKGVFQGNNEAMSGGIYLIIFPGKSNYIEFVIDTSKNFAINMDTTNIKNIKFINSPENDSFYVFQKFIEKTKAKHAKIDSQLRSAAIVDTPSISKNLVEEYNIINNYKNSYIQRNPTHFLSSLFALLGGPYLPKLATAADSFNYYKDHYWDNLPFSDNRVLRTPIFDQKLTSYVYNLSNSDNVDSITKKAFYILDEAKKDTTCYKYFLSKLSILYGNSMNPVQADVFYYIFTKYIENKKASLTWMTDELYDQMQKRASFIAGNIIGSKAFDITLLDTNNRKFNLYDIRSKYTVICFWDPICSHCVHVMPILDSLYVKKLKNKGVTMLGVYVDGGLENWKKYIATKNIGWLHGYESDSMRNALYAQQKPNFRQLYDIQQTPIIYILDQDKKIILKKITPEQLEYYFDGIENIMEPAKKEQPMVAPKPASKPKSKSKKK